MHWVRLGGWVSVRTFVLFIVVVGFRERHCAL
jgi:hypothetical protein